ncbi:hypothetical protein [Niveispirillum sp. KHB5.9]|uniref:hypothetical protein n=1 Tax=Niveispirillum sp. KHB5.9 TaxID=3400269 RepID=UPI003A8A65E7
MRNAFTRQARATGIAALLVAVPIATPVLADEAGKAVNTFKPITRAVTPGERAAAQSYARPGTEAAAAAALALSGEGNARMPDGFSLSVSGNMPSFSSGYGARRSNQLLGDGQIGYDAEPFYSNNRGYYTPYGYSYGTPRLNYNESFLRHKYGGNILGAPSVSAPLEFWDGRR